MLQTLSAKVLAKRKSIEIDRREWCARGDSNSQPSENLGLELKSQPETNAPDAAILQRRISKAGAPFGELSGMFR